MKVIVIGNQKAFVDDVDFKRLSKIRWMLRILPSGDIHARRGSVYMHHLVIGRPPAGKVVDHVNGNGLDNRLCNLRFCTRGENCRNQVKRRHKKTSSKFKGVTWDKNRKKWSAQIMFKRKRYHLGRFKSQVAAAKAYDRGAIKLFKKYAHLNFL